MRAIRKRPHDQRERILAFTEDLVSDLDVVDLDTIDGEFYWRCCRVDLLSQLKDMRREFPRPVGVGREGDSGFDRTQDGALEGAFELEGIFDYLRDALRFADGALRFADNASQLYPGVIWRSLIEGERLSMRQAESEIRRGFDMEDPPPMLRLKVYSGAWTGERVENEMRRVSASAGYRHTVDGETAASGMKLNISFDFMDEARARAECRPGETPRFPYVLVETPLPLPPEEMIKKSYDTLVCTQKNWHRNLPGASRQEKEVAVRTWAVGLLNARGEIFNDATGLVADRTGLTSVSQTRFGQDRLKLVERVPEAREFIFTKTSSTSSDTMADRSSALANLTESAPPLQPLAPETEAYP